MIETMIILGIFIVLYVAILCATTKIENPDVCGFSPIKICAIVLLVAVSIWVLVRMDDPSFVADYFTLKTAAIALAIFIFHKTA